MGLFTGITKHLTGTGYFNASSVNASVIGSGQFNDSTQSSGIITNLGIFAGTAVHSGSAENGQFYDDSINTGIIGNHGEFFGYSMNSGSVLGLAEFHSNSNNTGTSLSAAFADTSVNTGSVQTAIFNGSSINQGVVTGNAIFADTTTNNGLVQGDAQFAATATNSGTVSGTISEYVSGSNWYSDGSSAHHAVTLNGSVTQSDEGGGVKAALFDGNGYLSLADSSLNNVTGDFTFEVFAYPTNNSGFHAIASLGNYIVGILLRSSSASYVQDVMYIANNIVLTGNNWLTQNAWNHIALVRNSGTFNVYVNGVSVVSVTNSDALDLSNITIGTSVHAPNEDRYAGKLSNARLVIGTAIYTSNFSVPTTLPTAVTGTQLLLNFGATAAPTVNTNPASGTVLSTETNTININGNNYNNGTYDVIADGNGGSTNGNYQYAASGTEFYDDGSIYHYVSDGSGSYTQYYRSGYVISSGNTNTININGTDYNNGTYDVIADGNGGSTNGNYQYATIGTEFYNDGTSSYQSDGIGGYATVANAHWYDDTSSSPHAVTLNGSVTQSDEGGGVKAASFDGTTGYLTVPYDSGLNLTETDFTIDGWFKFNSIGEFSLLAKDNRANTSVGSYTLLLHNNVIFVSLGGADTNFGNYQSIPTTYTPQLDTWIHLAVVRDYTNSILYVFVNGTIVTQVAITATMRDIRNDLYIGLSSLSQGGIFDGKIAGLRVVKGTALYTSNFSVPTTLPTAVSGTQLLLNFGATAVPTVTPASNWHDDTSSSPHAVTLNGSVTQSNEGGGVKAALFDGSTGYLVTADNITLGETFTVEMFVYQNSGAGVGNGDFVAQSVGGLQFYHYNSDNNLWYSQGGVANLFGANVDMWNKWVHVEAVRDGSAVMVYLNGVAVITATDTTDFGSSPINIGAAPWANQWLYGKIAGLRITNTAVYNGNFAVPVALPTAVSGTQLLLNFGATAVPTVTWFSWNGYPNTGDSTTNCSSPYNHESLFSLVSTLTIGTQMYTDGSYDNLPQPNAAVSNAGGPGSVVIDGHIYHWGSDGKIDSITSCGGY